MPSLFFQSNLTQQIKAFTIEQLNIQSRFKPRVRPRELQCQLQISYFLSRLRRRIKASWDRYLLTTLCVGAPCTECPPVRGTSKANEKYIHSFMSLYSRNPTPTGPALGGGELREEMGIRIYFTSSLI